jgi:hypothetical protein
LPTTSRPNAGGSPDCEAFELAGRDAAARLDPLADIRSSQRKAVQHEPKSAWPMGRLTAPRRPSSPAGHGGQHLVSTQSRRHGLGIRSAASLAARFADLILSGSPVLICSRRSFGSGPGDAGSTVPSAGCPRLPRASAPARCESARRCLLSSVSPFRGGSRCRSAFVRRARPVRCVLRQSTIDLSPTEIVSHCVV